MPSRFERNSTDAISSTQPKGETENEAKDSHVSGHVVGRYSGISPGNFGSASREAVGVMLSPKTLERVSVSYRRGYYDGYDGKPSTNPERHPFDRPFANFDYEQGYKAGASDKKWYLKRQQDRTPAAGDLR